MLLYEIYVNFAKLGNIKKLGLFEGQFVAELRKQTIKNRIIQYTIAIRFFRIYRTKFKIKVLAEKYSAYNFEISKIFLKNLNKFNNQCLARFNSVTIMCKISLKTLE